MKKKLLKERFTEEVKEEVKELEIPTVKETVEPKKRGRKKND